MRRGLLARALAASLAVHVVVGLSLLVTVQVPKDTELTRVNVVLRPNGKLVEAASREPEVQPKQVMLSSRRSSPKTIVAQGAQQENFDFRPNSRFTVANREKGGHLERAGQKAQVEAEVTLPADVEVAYRLALARHAQGLIRYPEGARQRGEEGEVLLVVTIVGLLVRPVVSVERSSGMVELDRVALDALRLSAAQVTLPEGLSSGRFAVKVPIVFSLAR